MATTLRTARELCAAILVNRRTMATLKAETDALTLKAREALVQWGPIMVGERTVYVTAPSHRQAYDVNSLIDLARTLGATPEQIVACSHLTPVAPAVRDRHPQPSDR